MLVDFEDFLFDYLVNPTARDVETVLAKYRFVGREPIFEQRGLTCLEVRQMDIERQYGKSTRLPARFEFDTSDHAKMFIDLLNQHWDKLKAGKAA